MSSTCPPSDELEIDSGCEELNKSIRLWLEWDKNKYTLTQIRDLVKRKRWNELRNRLLTRIQFGTAGLRGTMKAGFNSMNDLVVVQTAQGLCKYILKCFPDAIDRKRGIVVGFDGRYNSERFAKLTATVFINKNIPVYLFSEMVPTPFVPFSIHENNCLAGVMVTASHNPKQDNGYKVYWANGAQIIAPHDKNIQKEILEDLKPFTKSWDLSILRDTPLLKDSITDIFFSYNDKIVQNIPQKFINNNAASNLQFVYTAMHGVGYPFVVEAFKACELQPLEPVLEQVDADPKFPTVEFPNPEEGKSCLKLSIDTAELKNIDIILANDPDADRLAVAERHPQTRQWKIFTGNEIGALLGWWALQCYLENNLPDTLSNCYMLASTVSSKMLRSMAKIEGFKFMETLTGFKWMGNEAFELVKAQKKVLFAFEEAIGFMFSTPVLDKDGVSAACHVATMSCWLKDKENVTLEEKLNELYILYGFHCTYNSYLFCYDPKTIEKIFHRIRNYAYKNYPKSICNQKVITVRDLTTGIDTSQPDGKAILPTSSSSQMITFSFTNWIITLRTSGTEPKIKFYSEVCAKPGQSGWEEMRRKLVDIADRVVDELLQPKLNGLKPKE